ncbi:MAG: PP2C family protein-serine/threonine phosphatase, partial [Planctomycetota bacterium]
MAASAGILAAGEPLGRSFDRCLEVCVEALDASSAAVLLLDDGAHLRPVAATGLDPESLEPVTAPPTGDLDAWAVSSAPVLAADTAPQCTVPLVFRGDAVGVLSVARSASAGAFGAEEEAALRTLAAQMALAAQAGLPREDIMARERLERALQFAHTLQGAFTPPKLPRMEGDLLLAARRSPSIEMEGDFFGVLPLTGGRLAVAVGETSGRGESAGVHIAQAVCLLRGALARTHDPAEALGLFSRELVTPMRRAFLANLALVTVDPATGSCAA